MLDLSKREELFMILSSKLEKEDAEKLERQISTFIIEQYNKKLDDHISILSNKNDKNMNSIKWNKKTNIEDIAINGKLIGYSNCLEDVIRFFNKIKNKNKDILIEILK